MGNIVTRFTERFGCKHPFACAGMAFAGTTDLALAVCRGGGVGAIGVGLMPAEQLRAMIHEMRKQTTAPFNVNLITFFDNDAQIRVCAEERVPVVSFHWGHPSREHIKLLRDAGVSVWVAAARAPPWCNPRRESPRGLACLRSGRNRICIRCSMNEHA